MATGNDSASIEPGFSRQTNLTVEGVSINLAIECRCVRTSLIADRLLEAQARATFPFESDILPPQPPP